MPSASIFLFFHSIDVAFIQNRFAPISCGPRLQGRQCDYLSIPDPNPIHAAEQSDERWSDGRWLRLHRLSYVIEYIDVAKEIMVIRFGFSSATAGHFVSSISQRYCVFGVQQWSASVCVCVHCRLKRGAWRIEWALWRRLTAAGNWFHLNSTLLADKCY